MPLERIRWLPVVDHAGYLAELVIGQFVRRPGRHGRRNGEGHGHSIADGASDRRTTGFVQWCGALRPIIQLQLPDPDPLRAGTCRHHQNRGCVGRDIERVHQWPCWSLGPPCGAEVGWGGGRTSERSRRLLGRTCLGYSGSYVVRSFLGGVRCFGFGSCVGCSLEVMVRELMCVPWGARTEIRWGLGLRISIAALSRFVRHADARSRASTMAIAPRRSVPDPAGSQAPQGRMGINFRQVSIARSCTRCADETCTLHSSRKN